MLMPRRRSLYIILSLLGVFLLGTVVVLSSVSYYLAIDPSAYLTELEVPILDNTTRWYGIDHGQQERIPRILHQTWKTDVIPTKWAGISQECRDMMPDYEYMLWTDANSREFIAENYPWFLDTFDGYEYNIQRADAIRYFILYHYGGVYMDLDIGCVRPVDPLLVYPVILPKTIPVGVSNDLMFAEKNHPFLAQTIHNLVTFDHSWILNYPTVMFSTGPMFLSAQYGIYTASHPGGAVRILPKSLYGKNAKEGEAPYSFFTHFYGSSWHADDAAFIGFLGTWGKGLMWVGLVVLVFGLGRLMFTKNTPRRYSLRRIGGYEVLLPRWVRRDGRWHLELGWSGSRDSPSDDSDPEIEDVSLLPYDSQSSWSSSSSELHSPTEEFPSSTRTSRSMFGTLHRAVASLTGRRRQSDRTPRRRPSSRGVLFFLPAIFTQSQEAELPMQRPSSPPPPPSYSRSATHYPPDKRSLEPHIARSRPFDEYQDDVEFEVGSSGHSSRSTSENEC